MKHKSMSEMNRERALRKAKEEADKDDEKFAEHCRKFFKGDKDENNT